MKTLPIRRVPRGALTLSALLLATRAGDAQPADETAEPAPASSIGQTEAAPTATSTATPTVTGSAPTPGEIADQTPATADDPPKKLAVGDMGWLKLGALLQFWALGSFADGATETTFRLRRAELKASGEIIPEAIGFKLMIDPAKVLESKPTTVPVEGQDPPPEAPATVTVLQPGDKLSVLQDFAITFFSQYADVSVGQFKNGLSYEGFNSSATLMFPERSPVARYYGDRRDIGLSADKSFERFGYFAGIFNGTGLNQRDDNNQKDLALRLEAYPLDGLLFGLVGYGSVGQRDQDTTKDRVEVDARLDLANLLLQAEYIRGWDGGSDARVVGHGFYGAVGYTFADFLQPVARIGRLDTDLDGDGEGDADEVTHYDVGVNAFILDKQARVELASSVFAYDQEPTQTDITLLVQASF